MIHYLNVIPLRDITTLITWPLCLCVQHVVNPDIVHLLLIHGKIRREANGNFASFICRYAIQQTEKAIASANNKHRIEPQSCGGAKETEWSVEIDRLYRGCYAALQSLIDTQTMQTRLLLRPVHFGFI